MTRVTKRAATSRRARIVSIVAGAAAASIVAPALAATVTWTGAVADPNSATYTATAQGTAAGFVSGQNIYLWNTSAANWSGAAAFTAGDNVIFTDNFAGGSDIRLTNGTLNPASITFSHIAGSTPVTYRFTHNGGGFSDFADSTSAALSANSPFGSGSSAILTLDTGFLGRVVLRQRANATSVNGNTIIKSGILEIGDGAALPGSANVNSPNVTMSGGEFRVNVNTQGNVAPASTQLVGTLSVTGNSILSNAAINNGRVWGQNGTVNIAAGTTLTVQSTIGFRADLPMFLTGTGTLALADVGTFTTTASLASNNARSTTMTFDLGSGNSELMFSGGSTTPDLGALTGGANTKLSGSTTGASLITYSIGARGDNTTFAGTVRNGSGANATAAITKVGADILTLTGNNTYTGLSTVNGGTLVVSGALGTISTSSGYVVNNNSLLRLDNTSSNNNRLSDTAPVTLNQGNLAFIGDQTTPTAESAGTLTIAGGANNVQATATGAGTNASLTFAGLSRTAGVVNFNTATGVNLAFTTAPTLTNGIISGYATVNTNDWTTLSGGIIGAYSAYTTDTGPGTWVATDNTNLTAGGTVSVAAPTSINSLRFATANTNVAIGAGQSLNIGTGGILATGTAGASISGPGSLTAGSAAGAELIALVQNAGNTLTISAPITDNGVGAVSLVKAGPGKLLLTGTGSTFTGGTSLIGGTLAVGVANFFPANSNLTLNYGTAFDINGFNQTFGTVAVIDGSIFNGGGGSPAVTANAYDVRKGNITANLAGTGALTKTTADTVTLSGANSYSGGTNVNNGTVIAAVTNTIPNGALTVNGGGTLNIGSTSQSVTAVVLGNNTTSSGNITGSGTITATSYDLQNGNITANLAGAGVGVTKAAINTTVTLSGSNTYTGPTTIANSGNSGTLLINSIANGGVASAIGASTSDAANLLLNGGTLQYNGSGHSTDRLFTMGANIAINASGTGPLTFSATGSIAGSGILTLTGTNTGTNTFSPQLGASISGLTKSSSGTWLLTNTGNNYTGITTISGGILQIPAIANGGASSPIGAATNAAANLVINNGTLKYTGNGATDRLFTIGTGGATVDASGSGPLQFTNSGAIVTNGAGLRTLTLTGSNSNANAIAGVLSNGSGTLALVKSGPGTWNVNGANTYTGATTVSAGTLTIGQSSRTSSTLVVADGARAAMTARSGTPDLASSRKTLQVGTLNLNTSGTLDLNDNDLVVNTGSFTAIKALVLTGFGNPAGPGIVSSTTDGSQILALFDNSLIGAGDWNGGTITATAVVGKYTYFGDVNFDGQVTGDDYTIIDSNLNTTPPVGLEWLSGDANLDGVVTGDDYTTIDSNLGLGVGNPLSPSALGGASAVPEPASLGVLGVAAASLTMRRRRRRQSVA